MSEFLNCHYKKIIGLICLTIISVLMAFYYLTTMTINFEVALDENTAGASVQTTTLSGQRESEVGQILEQSGYPVNSGEYTVSVPLNTKVKDISAITIKKNAKGTLNVDGKGRIFDSATETVGDLLEDSNVTLGIHDVVSPSITTPLTSDVKEIKVVRREIKEEEILETIPFTTDERINTTLPEGTQNIVIAGINGTKKTTDQLTYEDGVLVSRETIGSQVVVEPITELLEVGNKIVTEVKQEIKEEVLSYTTQKVENAELEKGKTNVKTIGVNGIALVTENVTYKNGVEVSREVATKVTTKEPVTEVIEMGTKAVKQEEVPVIVPTPVPTPEPAPVPIPEPTPAPTPVVPETTPEPEQNTSSSGVDLSNATHFTANCTAYVATGNTTASGAWPQSGHTIAADLSNYPIGTRIYIPYFDTIFTVEDSGGAVSGNVIDIFFDSYSEAINFGRRNLDAYVLN